MSSPSDKQRVSRNLGVKASIFDEMEGDKLSTRGFWSRNVPLLPKQSSQRTMDGTLFKRQLEKNTWKSARYELVGSCLIRFAENSRRPLKFVRIEHFRLEKLRLDEVVREVKYGFRLTQNGRFVELYARNKEAMLQWFEHLKDHCVLTSFSNDYATIKLMGKGNFARVYYARSRLTGGEFAVKAFEKASFQQASIDRAALIKEISILRKLRHPAVLKMYEVYENDTHILLVNELLKGGELFHKLKQHGRFKEQYVVKFIQTLLDAIKYLAESNILHRDIKPENLILRSKSKTPSPVDAGLSPTKDRRPESWTEAATTTTMTTTQDEDDVLSDLCLADFGLADYYDVKGGYMFSRCGTPGYVAPEILADKIYDFKVDVFSVGVIMFILLTGCSPFKGTSYDEIVIKNYNCTIDYECKEVVEAQLSPVCMDLLRKMLKKDPVARLSAAQALAHPWIDRGKSSKLQAATVASDSLMRTPTNGSGQGDETQAKQAAMGNLKTKTTLMNQKWEQSVDYQSPVTWKRTMNQSKVSQQQQQKGGLTGGAVEQAVIMSPTVFKQIVGQYAESPKTNTPGGHQYSMPKQQQQLMQLTRVSAAVSQHSKHFQSMTQLDGRKKLVGGSSHVFGSKQKGVGAEEGTGEFTVSSLNDEALAAAEQTASIADLSKSPGMKLAKFKYRSSLVNKSSHLSFTNASNISQSNYQSSIREQITLNI